VVNKLWWLYPTDAITKVETAWGFEGAHFADTSGLKHIRRQGCSGYVGTYSLPIKEKVKKYNELYNATRPH